MSKQILTTLAREAANHPNWQKSWGIPDVTEFTAGGRVQYALRLPSGLFKENGGPLQPCHQVQAENILVEILLKRDPTMSSLQLRRFYKVKGAEGKTYNVAQFSIQEAWGERTSSQPQTRDIAAELQVATTALLARMDAGAAVKFLKPLNGMSDAVSLSLIQAKLEELTPATEDTGTTEEIPF